MRHFDPKARSLSLEVYSAFRLDYWYLVGAAKGVSSIGTVDPFQNYYSPSTQAHAISLSPTFVCANASGVWHVVTKS